MLVHLLLLLIFFMMSKTKKSVCGVFSLKTSSIVILSFPVLTFFQAFFSTYIEAEDSFEIRAVDVLAFVFVCTCISALIGVELKETFLIKPVLYTIFLFIVTSLVMCIQYIVDHYNFKTGQFSSRLISTKFQTTLVLAFVILYAGQIILFHFTDLCIEDQPSKSKQSSESAAPMIRV